MKRTIPLLALALAYAGCVEQDTRDVEAQHQVQHELEMARAREPRIMYSWSLPDSDIPRTCKVGDMFVDRQGKLYTCEALWPPKEKR